MAQPVETSSRGERILVSCIGFNPASAVIAARHYRAARAVLVGTRDTQRQLDAVASQIAVPVRRIEMDDPRWPIRRLADAVCRAVAAAPGDDVVLDVTGGTKLMTLGVWIGTGNTGSQRVRVTYLGGDGRLVDPLTGDVSGQRVVIGIDEVLAWQGARISSARWMGPLDAVDGDLIARAQQLAPLLIRAVRQKALAIGQSANSASLGPIALPAALPAGVAARGNRLVSSVEGYFSHNAWLEEWCLAGAARVLRDAPQARAGLGIVATLGHHGQDEADVVLVNGARVCVVEAKARLSSDGAGAELQKRIAKTQEYFGDHAHVVFVHPAWGPQPSKHLVEVVGRRATLVGSRKEDLDRAIARAVLPPEPAVGNA